MKRELFNGVATALITPFKNGKVDFDALSTIVEQQINSNISALVVCGTTGEPSTMTTSEKESVISFVLEQVNGYIPVIVGTGGNNTAEVIATAKKYQKLGATAQLCVTPYYNKTTQAGLVAHYTAIADSDTLPIILYNVPGRTGLNMLPETVAKLSEHRNIIALKEANCDLVQLSEVFRLCGDNITVYSGADELIIPMMSLGAMGVISVVANAMPKETSDMVAMYLSGMHREARDAQLRMLPFIKALFKQTSPSPIKAAMQMLGLCSDEVRLPLITLNKKEKEELKKIMEGIL